MGRRGFQRRRRGAILVVVLVCLAIATALSVVVVGHIATDRRGAQMDYRRLQASWLAEAGIERAASRLAADPEYTGETWNVSTRDLATGGSGVVSIQVEAMAGRPQQRSVRVEAEYADTPDYRCRHVKHILVDRDALPSQQPTKAPD